MIRACNAHEFETIWTIVNDGARAYAGVVPSDCLHDPYMSKEELQHEVGNGVVFWGYEDAGVSASYGLSANTRLICSAISSSFGLSELSSKTIVSLW